MASPCCAWPPFPFFDSPSVGLLYFLGGRTFHIIIPLVPLLPGDRERGEQFLLFCSVGAVIKPSIPCEKTHQKKAKTKTVKFTGSQANNPNISGACSSQSSHWTMNTWQRIIYLELKC